MNKEEYLGEVKKRFPVGCTVESPYMGYKFIIKECKFVYDKIYKRVWYKADMNNEEGYYTLLYYNDKWAKIISYQFKTKEQLLNEMFS